ncbi:MAG: hypothetical protein NVS4B10_05440 [Myxococcales bacterium]
MVSLATRPSSVAAVNASSGPVPVRRALRMSERPGSGAVCAAALAAAAGTSFTSAAGPAPPSIAAKASSAMLAASASPMAASIASSERPGTGAVSRAGACPRRPASPEEAVAAPPSGCAAGVEGPGGSSAAWASPGRCWAPAAKAMRVAAMSARPQGAARARRLSELRFKVSPS